MLVHSWQGIPLTREHGGPVRLVIPHLYFWKSAKWINRIEFLGADKAGFWEVNGYHMRGDPWARNAAADLIGQPKVPNVRQGSQQVCRIGTNSPHIRKWTARPEERSILARAVRRVAPTGTLRTPEVRTRERSIMIAQPGETPLVVPFTASRR